jgi:hypothetical protein
MGNGSIQWLVEEFTFLGMHFQSWMPVVAAIIVLGILFAWSRGSFSK